MQSRRVRIALGAKLPRRSQLAVENPIPISFRVARQAHANAVDERMLAIADRLAHWVATCAALASTFSFDDRTVATLDTHA
jgi:hypothetical protein